MCFESLRSLSRSLRRATTVSSAILVLTLSASISAVGQAPTAGTGADGDSSDTGVYTITNETLARAARSSAPVVSVGQETANPASTECLPLAQLNEQGAQAADLAREYFLEELDSLARDHDLATADGWLNAAPKMKALASRISAQAGQVYDEQARKLLFDFADDISATASWVASRPIESAQKFQRGEAIFSRRF